MHNDCECTRVTPILQMDDLGSCTRSRCQTHVLPVALHSPSTYKESPLDPSRQGFPHEAKWTANLSTSQPRRPQQMSERFCKQRLLENISRSWHMQVCTLADAGKCSQSACMQAPWRLRWRSGSAAEAAAAAELWTVCSRSTLLRTSK